MNTFTTSTGQVLQHLKATNFKHIEKEVYRILHSVDPSKSAVVFDIDETVLMNDDRIRECDGARPNMCIMRVYKRCLELDISVFFVTARRDSPRNRDWTKRQLNCIGAHTYKKLYMKPEEYQTAPEISTFKRGARNEIRQEFKRHIVLNVGDQWTDMLEMSTDAEIDAFITRDNKSYWLFQPIEQEEISWDLKLPDRYK